jgi:hypothetical protein
MGSKGWYSSEEKQKAQNINSEIQNSLNFLLLLDSKVRLNSFPIKIY